MEISKLATFNKVLDAKEITYAISPLVDRGSQNQELMQPLSYCLLSRFSQP